MKGTFPVDKFRQMETPFYYYYVKIQLETFRTINT